MYMTRGINPLFILPWHCLQSCADINSTFQVFSPATRSKRGWSNQRLCPPLSMLCSRETGTKQRHLFRWFWESGCPWWQKKGASGGSSWFLRDPSGSELLGRVTSGGVTSPTSGKPFSPPVHTYSSYLPCFTIGCACPNVFRTPVFPLSSCFQPGKEDSTFKFLKWAF